MKLVVPASEQPNFDVAVAAIESKSGELAAPVKELTVALDDPSFNVTPANAPPEVQTATAKTGDKTDAPAAEAEQVAAVSASEFGRRHRLRPISSPRAIRCFRRATSPGRGSSSKRLTRPAPQKERSARPRPSIPPYSPSSTCKV
ncbi:MAG: hypothetical protein HC855_15195 [Rhizobiales bacterium]|nr:hypothetical protein [Hyphomicrobiales bacterium]